MMTDLDAIAALAAEGLSAGEMARRLGWTRNKMIGFCRRRGIRLARAHVRAPLPADEPPPRVALPAEPGQRGCRWPMWGNAERPTHRYCGGEVEAEGASYCKRHADRAYQRGAKRAAAEQAIDYIAGRAAGGQRTVAAE